jgi:hypothetical protein
LHGTKANDGKRTLLHFMLQQMEKDHPDLIKFGDEFQGVAEVASKSKKTSSRFIYIRTIIIFALFL